MNNKMLTVAAVLAATLVAGVFATTPMAAYAGGDSSETSTEQKIKQKNFGSGDSTNVNCADQDIHGATTEDGLLPETDAQVCGTLDVDVLTDLIAGIRAPE
jgi:hypothetical protein